MFPATVAAARYKPVHKKIRPVPGIMPEEARTIRRFPEDPLLSLPSLSPNPPPFTEGKRVTRARLDELDIGKGGFLNEEEVRLFEYILRINENALAFDESEKGRFRDDYFSPYKIPTVDHVPWQHKPLPIPPSIRAEISKMFYEKIKNGTYEPAQSSYCSKWFVVMKKSGSFRIVHDLQPLNAVTIRDAGLPPNIEEFVEDMAARSCYSLLDIFVGYDNRKLHLDSRDMTAFMSPNHGLLRLTVLPQGGANCVPEFQACLVFILQDEIPKVLRVFVDDVPIKGPKTRYELADGSHEISKENPKIRRFVWEHAKDVHRILHRIGHSGATVAAKKLVICAPEAVIVGHKCTYEGRLPDDSKVSKIKNWGRPKNTTDLRGFLGTCAVVRIWIKDFAKIARPLNALLHKDATWSWMEEHDDAMNRLKDLLTSPPCLTPINYESEYEVILAVDSSKYAVGFILFQLNQHSKRKPARYGSLTFNDRESRYSQAKLELYGLSRALSKVRVYIFGVRNLVVEVDAKYIKGMLNSPDTVPSATLNRWVANILLYNFVLRHVPAKDHAAADGLSRRARVEEDTEDEDSEEEEREKIGEWPKVKMEGVEEVAVATIHQDRYLALHTAVNEEIQQKAEHRTNTPTKPVTQWTAFRQAEAAANFPSVRHFLKTGERPLSVSEATAENFAKMATKFFLANGRLFRRAENSLHQLVIKKEDRGDILTRCHDRLGHKGIAATQRTVLDRFWWPNVENDINIWVRTCHQCQTRKERNIHIPVTPSSPTQLFRHFDLDIMFMPMSKGFTRILAARDNTSGYPEMVRLKKATAENVAKFIFEDIICRWGAVEEISTDNGSEFIGKAVELLVEKYNIHPIRISPYNSRANGVVERGHRTFREALMRTCKHESDWAKNFHHVLWAERATVRPTTGYSPFYLAHGHHPLLPTDAFNLTFAWDIKQGMTHEELVAARARLLMRKPEDEELALERLAKSRWKSADQWNRSHQAALHNTRYKPGELVLVRNSMIEKDLGRKTKPRWLGPMVVIRQTKGGSYILAELNGTIARNRFAAFRVTRYHHRDGLTFDIGQWLTEEVKKDAEKIFQLLEEEEARTEEGKGTEGHLPSDPKEDQPLKIRLKRPNPQNQKPQKDETSANNNSAFIDNRTENDRRVQVPIRIQRLLSKELLNWPRAMHDGMDLY